MTSPDPSKSGEYNVKTSRIKLKETSQARADRIYRKEQRRHQRDTRKTNRANGYAVSPPRVVRDDSMSPPRRRTNPIQVDDSSGDEEEGYRWMGNRGRQATEEAARREEEERMAYLYAEEMGAGNPFGNTSTSTFRAYSTMASASFTYTSTTYIQPTPPSLHIPNRFRPAPPPPTHTHIRYRDPAFEIDLDGNGPAPDIGSMTENEYTEFIRLGMYRRQHHAEIQAEEQRRRVREEEEKRRELEREKERKEEKRRMARIRAQKGFEEEERLRVMRERYRVRWKSVGEVGGEVEESNLSFGDIPWPLYPAGTVRLDDLETERVGGFLVAIARDMEGAEGEDVKVKKVLREAIRQFHPDRFFSRILSRVKEGDREMVKEGAERCSRIINSLAAENRT